MKEITPGQLNMVLLGKRTKEQLIQMICHVANMANEYTVPGLPCVGDQALFKLNLTKPNFTVRERQVIIVKQKPRPYSPRLGDEVVIVKSSVFYGPGKIGVIEGPSDGGWMVRINYKDSFSGDQEAKEHVIWAEEVKPHVPTPAKKEAHGQSTQGGS